VPSDPSLPPENFLIAFGQVFFARNTANRWNQQQTFVAGVGDTRRFHVEPGLTQALRVWSAIVAD
jgi:hypothetical protein